MLNLLDWFNDEFIHAPLIPIYLMRIRFQVVTILDTVVCSGTLLLMFSMTCNNEVVVPGLILVQLQLIPDAVYLPF